MWQLPSVVLIDKTDRTEDQQVLLRYSLVNGAERGPDAVGAMVVSGHSSTWRGSIRSSPTIFVSVPQGVLCNSHIRESIAALCTMTQKHVVHGQPGCTGNSQMGAVPWMTLVQGSEQAKCK